MKTETAKPRAPRKRKAPGSETREWTPEQKQEIAQRAYELFLARGGQHGYHMKDWLKAEAEFAGSTAGPKRRRAQAALA